MPPNRRSAAFTLVELLVVIGLIALLISILLPAISAARNRGQEIACGSNARQLNVAWQMYADNNQGRLPGSSTYGQADWVRTPTSGPETEADLAAGRLWSFLESSGVYGCPADTREDVLRSYSLSDRLSGEGAFGVAPEKKISRVTASSETMTFLGENDIRGSNLGSFVLNPLTPAWLDPVAAWHRRKELGATTLAFADGHAELFRWGDRRTGEFVLSDNVYTFTAQPDNEDLRTLARRYDPKLARSAEWN